MHGMVPARAKAQAAQACPGKLHHVLSCHGVSGVQALLPALPPSLCSTQTLVAQFAHHGNRQHIHHRLSWQQNGLHARLAPDVRTQGVT